MTKIKLSSVSLHDPCVVVDNQLRFVVFAQFDARQSDFASQEHLPEAISTQDLGCEVETKIIFSVPFRCRGELTWAVPFHSSPGKLFHSHAQNASAFRFLPTSPFLTPSFLVTDKLTGSGGRGAVEINEKHGPEYCARKIKYSQPATSYLSTARSGHRRKIG